MNLHLSMALRPSSFIIMQGHAALVVLFSLMLWWFVMVKQLKYENLNDENVDISLYLGTKYGNLVLQGINSSSLVIQLLNANGNLITNDRSSVSCKGEACSFSFEIGDIVERELKYVLAVTQKGQGSIHLNDFKKKGLTLLIAMMVTIFIAMFSFLYLNIRATRREMELCAPLIKQIEATQQAERKNMNKSLAFARANHDVRTSLAGLTCLLEMSYHLVTPHSELEANLNQMNNCIQDLLGLLNSILDTSKIEAGEMHLEEEEFDLSQLLEDVVDLYHPVGMKKGVDIVLDPCNGSLMRYSHVKGDRGKLKQVLCNLLSNAVKFTDNGHIAVRAWARKSKMQNSIMNTNRYRFIKPLSRLFCKKNKTHCDIEADMSSIQQDNNYSIDVTFEVDDTGKGIPKEKYKSVFENYVQVKETALGQGGTGLGLGIVQSLVRLMHGDIRIVDKDVGENGTCFRFNVVLTACGIVRNGSRREGTEYGSGDRNNAQGLMIRSTSSGSSIYNSFSPGLRVCSYNPRPQTSHVVLLIVDKERQRTSQRFMESIGIKVKVVNQWKHLLETLNKIKQNGDYSTSHTPFPGASGIHLTSQGRNESIIGTVPCFILIIIDANAGPFSELCSMISSFRKGLLNPSKVVWLNKPLLHGNNFKILDKDLLDPNDIVLSKPFHGSRLTQIIQLLPEYSGAWKSIYSRSKRESAIDHRVGKTCTESSLSKHNSPLHDKSQVELNTNGSSFQCTEQIMKGTQGESLVHQEKTQECEGSINNKPLSGKNVLVVEDNALLRKLALATLVPLGATIEQCENGEQAVQLVKEGLSRTNFPNLPYDYIIIDCEMPVMNGFEATRLIREMEKPYGIRIPIIALTAHTSNIVTEDGMDFHLVKPIKAECVLEAIRHVHGRD